MGYNEWAIVAVLVTGLAAWIVERVELRRRNRVR